MTIDTIYSEISGRGVSLTGRPPAGTASLRRHFPGTAGTAARQRSGRRL